MTQNNARRKPTCPQCRSKAIGLMEEHIGYGIWASDEWSYDADGGIVHEVESGASSSQPTGRFLYDCEDCGHQWTRRNRG